MKESSLADDATNIVYKYLPPARLTYLDDGLLRFTQPAALNDPFECLPRISVAQVGQLLREETDKNIDFVKNSSAGRKERRANVTSLKRKRRKQNTKTAATARDDYWQQFNRFQNKQVGIFSLSARADSTLMWAHYCESHAGFCIGFRGGDEFFLTGAGRGKDNVIPLQPVRYSNERVQIPLEDGKKLQIEHILTKCKDWEYEAEMRVAFRLKTADKTLHCKPYRVHLFEVPHLIISEMIVGARATKQVRDKVLAFAKKLRVPCLQAVPSDETFDMEIKPTTIKKR